MSAMPGWPEILRQRESRRRERGTGQRSTGTGLLTQAIRSELKTQGVLGHPE